MKSATKKKNLNISEHADSVLKLCRKERGFRTEREYIERLIFEDLDRLRGSRESANLNALLNSIHELTVMQGQTLAQIKKAQEQIEHDSAVASALGTETCVAVLRQRDGDVERATQRAKQLIDGARERLKVRRQEREPKG